MTTSTLPSMPAGRPSPSRPAGTQARRVLNRFLRTGEINRPDVAITRFTPKALFFLSPVRPSRAHMVAAGWQAWSSDDSVAGLRARCGWSTASFALRMELDDHEELCDFCILADLTSYALYRLFDADGRLLYVGQTGSLAIRLEQHRRQSPWWSEVVSCKYVDFPDEHSAREAERDAVQAERPIHNVDLQRPGNAPPRIASRRSPGPVQHVVRWSNGTVFHRSVLEAALLSRGIRGVRPRAEFLGVSISTVSRLLPSARSACSGFHEPSLDTVTAIRRALPEVADRIFEFPAA